MLKVCDNSNNIHQLAYVVTTHRYYFHFYLNRNTKTNSFAASTNTDANTNIELSAIH